MKFFLYIFALTAYASAATISESLNTGRIVNGHPVTIEQYPYQVSVRRDFNKTKDDFHHFCGGSIYTDYIIITAAHCVHKRGPEVLQVVAGSTFKNGTGGIILPVKQVIGHKDWTYETMNFDIALLVLSSPLPLNNKTMKAIQLAEDGPYEGEIGTITGWGALEEDGNEADQLQAVEVPVFNTEICNVSYLGYITDMMFCAGYFGVGGKDACQGDSGGPFAVNGKLAGLVSWGESCADPDYPGVYAKISALRPWILENAKKINDQTFGN